MRVLCTTQPGVGHFRGLLPLAGALRAAGHEVAFAASNTMRGAVVAEGFPFLPVGRSWEMNLEADALFPGFPPPGPESKRFTLCEVFAKTTARWTFPDVLEVLRRHFRADLVLRESEEYGGLLAAEAAGIPHASVATNAESATLGMGQIVADSLTEAAQGLPVPGPIGLPTIHRYLHLCTLPSEFDGPLSLFPTTAHFVRLHPPRAPRRPAAPESSPLVLAAMGTIFHQRPGLFESIFAALAGLPVDGVLAVGKDRDPASFGAAPNLKVERYVDQTNLLDACQAFITHAGPNSVKEAIASSVPVLCLPIAADQPYVAQRCEALGLGVRLSLDEATPEAIRAGLMRLLEDRSFSDRIAAFRRELEAMPGPARAVQLLETLAATRTPLLRQRA